jgi:hypothetical protein
MLEMNNQLQRKMDSDNGNTRRAGVRSVTADIERLTETMAMLESYVDGLLDRTNRVSRVIRRSPK